MAPAIYSEFIRFLVEDLSIASSAVDFAIKQRENAIDPLPMILWQYGLISLDQLDKIFDWLETV
jgi:Protein of unknown function (DUF2949)